MYIKKYKTHLLYRKKLCKDESLPLFATLVRTYLMDDFNKEKVYVILIDYILNTIITYVREIIKCF